MAEYVVKGAEPNETVLHSRTPNGYEAWHWLPVREEIVRCKDCKWFDRDRTPEDDYPHFCHEIGIDLMEDDGFCAWGGRREDA